jgi:hypothetical protein
MLRPVRAVATPTLERAIDGLLASELPEALAHSLVEHRVVRRMAVEALEHADVEGAITSALESERAERIVRELLASPAVERMLKSPEFERVLGQILASPQVRRALAQQSTSLAAESAAGARRGAVRLDDVVERRPRRWLVELVTSLVGALRPVWLAETLAGISWLLLQIAYFAGFWSTAGQTPGMRVMRVRVLDRANGRPSFGRSVVRLAGLFLAIVPCCAGLLPAFVDDRRRALHDFIAGTVVVYASGHPKGMTSPSLACPSVAATRESGRSEPSPL